MQGNSKALPIRRPGCSIDIPFTADLDQASSNLATSIPASPLSNDWFGRSIAQLLECNRCYLAVLSPGDGARVGEVRIGCCSKVEAIPTATVIQIASQLGSQDDCIFQSVATENRVARKLIGGESTFCPHCVIGRVQSRCGATALFVAGWRRTPFSMAAFGCVVRAIDVMWEALAQVRTQRQQTWLEEIVPPAFIVDENLVVRSMNGSCRRLLTERGILSLEHGTISGSNASVTASLREAVHRAIDSDLTHRFRRSMVVLSSHSRKFAFAVVGKPPAYADPAHSFVFVPQFDERSGARQTAAAFNLSWVEEKIIAGILRGRCARLIGTDLGLTEETIKTYTKRIMLKVGINHRSEFFMLYSLMFSPFKMGQQNHHTQDMPARTQIRARDLRSKAS